jgi:hypothetical protein
MVDLLQRKRANPSSPLFRSLRGARQRTVATLGRLPGLDEEARVGWEHIGGIPDGKARPADFLNPLPDPPEWTRVDFRGVRVQRLRSFGSVYPALGLWRRLRLDAFFNEAMEAVGRSRNGSP